MGIANSNFIKAGVKVLTTFLDVINSISGALGDSAIGQGFEALFKIGLAFAAWQLLPKIIGKVFNHLAKDMVGFGVEQAAMAAETETVGARMSATLAEIKAQFASTAAAASAMSAEVVAAEEAMAAGTTAAAAEFNNVSTDIFIDVPAGCCTQISVKNSGAQAVAVQNANLIVERVA